MAKVIASVVILHSILVSILGRFIGVGGGGAAVTRLVRTGEGWGKEADKEGKDLIERKMLTCNVSQF